MNGLLLDTHAYVWAVTDPARLPDGVLDLLSDATVPVSISAVSLWEMAIKHRAGRWPEVEPLLLAHDRIVARLRVATVPVDADDAIRAGALTWDHRDPFDRMLAAQSLRRDLTLVSRDTAFQHLAGLQLRW